MCINRGKKVYLNGNVWSNIKCFITPKKQAKFIWPYVVLLCIKMQHVYLCYKVVNHQTLSPWPGVSLLRENTNIFTNVSYILHICIDKIYISSTLFKGKISYKILVWSQASLLLKELTLFIYFELINVFGIMRSCRASQRYP